MKVEEARERILLHLRQRGRATYSELERLAGNDQALFREVREDLILDGVARDKAGVGLVYLSPEPSGAAPAPVLEAAAARPRLFLSYARGDDEAFVRRLHGDLTARGFQAWFDRVSLPSRQLTFHQEIVDAIRNEVDRLIYVAGASAAQSDYVRQEWRFALELDRPVVPILRSGDYLDLPSELALLHCEDFRDDRVYATQLEKLIANLDRPEPPLGALFAMPALPPQFMARPELLRPLRDALLADLERPVVVSGATRVGAQVGLQGMGGIGKSVLAAAVARDRQLRRAYPDGVVWVTVGPQPNLLRLQLDIAGHLGSTGGFTGVEQGKTVLGALLAEKAVMFILDDVWEAHHVGAFSVLGPRGRILITTRDAGILDAFAAERVLVSLFSEHEALQLLAESATGVGEQPLRADSLAAEAREVVSRCGFLPLAITLCGAMARAGASWIEILTALRQAELAEIGQRQLRDTDNPHHRSLWTAMLASVDHLGDEGKKRRFAELAVFATDRPVPEAAVSTLWAHTGNLGAPASRALLIELFERSLIRLEQRRQGPGETAERRFSLHDLLHDCAARLAGDPTSLHASLLAAYEGTCAGDWPRGPNDGYFFQALLRHMVMAKRGREARRLVMTYPWISARLRSTGIVATMEDYDRMSPEPNDELDLVRDTLRLSAHVLEKRPQELPWQLFGRAGGLPIASLKDLANSARAELRRPALVPVWPRLTPPGGPLLRSLEPPGGVVRSVAIGPDCRTCVLGTNDPAPELWDLTTGKPLRAFSGEEGGRGVDEVAISPDGKMCLAGAAEGLGRARLKLWDLANGELLRDLEVDASITAVAFSPDGRIALAGSYDRNIRLWDLASGELIRAFEAHENADIVALAIDPTGRSFLSASSDGGGGERETLKVWDFASGGLVRSIQAGSIRSLSISPDGEICVCGTEEETIDVWEIASGRKLRSLEDDAGPVQAVAVSPDGATCVSAASYASTLKLWDLSTGALLRVFEGHQGQISAVAISPDGKTLVSGASDGTAKVWELGSDAAFPSFEQHRQAVQAIGCPDSETCVSVSNGSFKLWDLASGEMLHSTDFVMPYLSLRHPTTGEWLEGSVRPRVSVMAIGPDGRAVVVGSQDTRSVQVLGLPAGNPIGVYTARGPVWKAAVGPDGKTCLCDGDIFEIFSLRSGERLLSFEMNEGVTALDISADGTFCVSGSEGVLKVWDLSSGSLVRVIDGHEGWVYAVAISSDGKTCLSGSGDKTLKHWDLASGTLLRTFDGHEDMISVVAMSPDSRICVSGSDDKTLKLWDVDSAVLLASFTGDGTFCALDISPDGRYVLAGDALGRVHRLEICP